MTLSSRKFAIVAGSILVLQTAVATSLEALQAQLEEQANQLKELRPDATPRYSRFSLAARQDQPDDMDSTSTSAYRDCFPNLSTSAEEMLAVVNECSGCLSGGPGTVNCPDTCCMSSLDSVVQTVLCADSIGCMRLFGEAMVNMWTWESAAAERSVPEGLTCDAMMEDSSLSQKCAVRFGIDDDGVTVLAPCPVGSPGTGFLVPSTSEVFVGPAQCVPPPPLRDDATKELPTPLPEGEASPSFEPEEPTFTPTLPGPTKTPTPEPSTAPTSLPAKPSASEQPKPSVPEPSSGPEVEATSDPIELEGTNEPEISMEESSDPPSVPEPSSEAEVEETSDPSEPDATAEPDSSMEESTEPENSAEEAIEPEASMEESNEPETSMEENSESEPSSEESSGPDAPVWEGGSEPEPSSEELNVPETSMEPSVDESNEPEASGESESFAEGGEGNELEKGSATPCLPEGHTP